MTFRDDHDAAIARADALAEDLRRSEDERERLRAELKHAREREPAPAPPNTLAEDLRRSEAERERLRAELELERERAVASARRDGPLVLARSVALTERELQSLVAELERGGRIDLHAKSSNIARSLILVVMGVGTCFATLVAGFVLIAMGLCFLVWSLVRPLGDHPAIIDLVRDNPDKIYRVIDQTSEKGLRWLEIRTRDGARADFYPGDPTQVIQALARRCPKAIVG